MSIHSHASIPLSDLVPPRTGPTFCDRRRPALADLVQPAPPVVDLADIDTSAPVVDLDTVALELFGRLRAADVSLSDALEMARRSVISRQVDRVYVEHGRGHYVVRCPECDGRTLVDTYREMRDLEGWPCSKCRPAPEAPSDARFADDRHQVVKGRSRKGRQTVRVMRRSDWTVVGSREVRPVDLTPDQVADLDASGFGLDAWSDAWSSVLTSTRVDLDGQTVDRVRRRSDGGFRGSDVSRVADLMLNRDGRSDVDTDPGTAADVPARIGAANGLAWAQVLTLSPTSAVWARQRCGIAGYFDSRTLPDLDGRTLADNQASTFYVVERSTVADLADVRMPTVSGIPTVTRRRMPIGRARQSEVPAWAAPLRFGALTVSYLYGPTLDGRVWIGHDLVDRGATTTTTADLARETVDGQRVRTLRAARTFVALDVDQAPTSVEGWELLAETLAPGERLTFQAVTGHGTVTVGASGRFAARFYDGTNLVRLAGVRSPHALAVHLARLVAVD